MASKGKTYEARLGYRMRPPYEIKMYFEPKEEQSRAWHGVSLGKGEFVTDSVDELVMVVYLHRTDSTDEEAALDVPGVTWKVECEGTDKHFFNIVNKGEHPQYRGKTRFSIKTDEVLSYSEGKNVETKWKVKASIPQFDWLGPAGQSRDSLEIEAPAKIFPRYIYMKLWVVPGTSTATSEAACAVTIMPPSGRRPLTYLEGIEVEIKVDSHGGGAALQADNAVANTEKGFARWVLSYSNLTWDNHLLAFFHLECQVKFGEKKSIPVNFSINVAENIRFMLDALYRNRDGLKLANPWFLGTNDISRRVFSQYRGVDGGISESSSINLFRGPFWNAYHSFLEDIPSLVTETAAGIHFNALSLSPDYETYLCQKFQARIYEFFHNLRFESFKAIPGNVGAMNGIEINTYSIWPIHHTAGFYLSGMEQMDCYLLDPWWYQEWTSESTTISGLITPFGENSRFYSILAGILLLGSLLAAAFAIKGAAVALPAVLAKLKLWLSGSGAILGGSYAIGKLYCTNFHMESGVYGNLGGEGSFRWISSAREALNSVTAENRP